MDRLLLVLPVPAFRVPDGDVYIDKQACNGLRLWLKNFEGLTLACPTHDVAMPPPNTSPMQAIEDRKRVSFEPLPVAYTPYRAMAHVPRVARRLRSLISEANYLHFAIGGLWGDWASLACLIAWRAGLPYAVWTDRVESQVIEFNSQSKSGLRRVYAAQTAWLTHYYERFVIGRCSLGLFHGSDCYSTYAAYCKNPHLVHNIHVGDADRVRADELSLRRKSSQLRIAYAGQAVKMKGVQDWITTLARAAKNGIAFEATWFGDGPELPAARQRTMELGLADHISFPGFVDHDRVLQQLKTFDVFLFCHKTLESPRCLVEATICGLPIVGYSSCFAADLISRNGGGVLTPIHDTERLANSLADISKDQQLLQDLTKRAILDSFGFTSDAVFQHRSELMKTIRIKPSVPA